MLSSDLVNIERFISYVRIPGTMLGGFYDLGPESFSVKYNCGENCINFRYEQNIALNTPQVTVTDGTLFDSIYKAYPYGKENALIT
jgi:hypothetical protein